MSGRTPPADPSELTAYNGVVMRSLHTGRIRHWMLRNRNGVEAPGTLTENIITNDPAAMREAARLGLGVSLIALIDVLSDLQRGDLIRLLPDWYADAGAISLYYPSRTMISSSTPSRAGGYLTNHPRNLDRGAADNKTGRTVILFLCRGARPTAPNRGGPACCAG
jgi:DNA-binding transcriptional LysR family regulator